MWGVVKRYGEDVVGVEVCCKLRRHIGLPLGTWGGELRCGVLKRYVGGVVGVEVCGKVRRHIG